MTDPNQQTIGYSWEAVGNPPEKRSLTGSIAKAQTPDDPALQAVLGTFSYQYDGKNYLVSGTSRNSSSCGDRPGLHGV